MGAHLILIQLLMIINSYKYNNKLLQRKNNRCAITFSFFSFFFAGLPHNKANEHFFILPFYIKCILRITILIKMTKRGKLFTLANSAVILTQLFVKLNFFLYNGVARIVKSSLFYCTFSSTTPCHRNK